MARNLLLIEDNPGDAVLVREWLRVADHGKYDIEVVMTLNDGLSKLEEQRYDVILSDLSLPDSDGLNIIDKLQALVSDVPIIVMTGNDNKEMAIQAVKQGAQDYLVKGQGDGLLISRSIDYSIERKKVQLGLAYLAQYDSLTGLANRTLFRERLDRALIRSGRNDTYVALMFIDLDRFKNINDTLGHDAGDALLVEVANRLTSVTREGDTIARLGGDEFTIIMEEIRDTDVITNIARKIIEHMLEPFELNGVEVFVTPSIGITIYPQDGEDVGRLLKNADTAMYRAKDMGRSNFQFFTADMNIRSIERLDLESKLRRSLENREFKLCYQPKHDLYSGGITGAEALIRWQHPDLGLMPPGKFIPLAEEIGMIEAIGNWVIEAACEQMARWRDEPGCVLPVAVNISVRQLRNPEFVSFLEAIFTKHDVPPSCLELEITESVLMERKGHSIDVMGRLKNLGVRLSIDDFGTGYSSLNYLRRFDVDCLKIDKSFVAEISEETGEGGIATAIIALAKSLKMKVIAEGVEAGEQVDYLKRHDCDEAQGFYFSRPLTVDSMTERLRREFPALSVGNYFHGS